MILMQFAAVVAIRRKRKSRESEAMAHHISIIARG